MTKSFFSVFFPQGNNHCLKLSKQETNVSIINLSLNSDRTVSTCLTHRDEYLYLNVFPHKFTLLILWLDQGACTPLLRHMLAGWPRRGLTNMLAEGSQKGIDPWLQCAQE